MRPRGRASFSEGEGTADVAFAGRECDGWREAETEEDDGGAAEEEKEGCEEVGERGATGRLDGFGGGFGLISPSADKFNPSDEEGVEEEEDEDDEEEDGDDEDAGSLTDVRCWRFGMEIEARDGAGRE